MDFFLNKRFLKKEAKDGIYKLIGDGLRRHQNLLSNSDDFGMDQVINGTGAYIRVNTTKQKVLSQNTYTFSIVNLKMS